MIEDMTEEDVGTYTCIAKNVAGISKAVTEVILLGKDNKNFINIKT